MNNQKFRRFLKRFNEYVPFLAALIIWWVAQFPIRLLDPHAATDDAGLIQGLLFAMVLYFAACTFSWFALRIIFPKIGRFVDDDFEAGWSQVHKGDKRIYSLVLFGFYFLGAIIIFASI